MKDLYVLVIGDNPEESLKKQSAHIDSWKESNWLYDGLVLSGEYTMESLAEAVSKDPRFQPYAIIDNGKFISKDNFGSRWGESLKDCIKMTSEGQSVNIFTCHKSS